MTTNEIIQAFQKVKTEDPETYYNAMGAGDDGINIMHPFIGDAYALGLVAGAKYALENFTNLEKQEESKCDTCPNRGNTHQYLKGYEDGLNEGKDKKINLGDRELPQLARVKKTGEIVNITNGQLDNGCKKWISYSSNREDGFNVYKPDDLIFLSDEPKQPAKWSEEDKKMLDLLIAIIKVNHPDGQFKTTDNFISSEEVISWLKSLHPQPKQEWSEKDEKNIEKLDGFLSEVFCYGHVYISQKDKEKLQNWLKSLRPQPHWKPSEVQMEALAWYSGNSDVPPTGDKAIKSLYNDLKKL